jgi:Patatin-like phospholipase
LGLAKKEALEKQAAAKKEALEKQAAELLFKNELIVDAERALYEEYKALCHGKRPSQTDTLNELEQEKQLTAWLAKQPKYAVCLSGGGIRSAAFCMGALRALALNKMLPQFHYLSTVSGGGYIGGWLQHLIMLKDYSVKDAAKVLASSQALPEVKNLRDFTNFLAPTPGLLSADALSGGVLYMRNLIVNWIMFLPALVALALVPGLYRDILCAVAADGQTSPWSGEPVLVAALLFLIGLGTLAWSVFHACLFVPSHSHDIDADTRKPIQNDDPGAELAATGKSRPKELGSCTAQINRNVMLPALVWALLVPLCFAALSRPPEAIGLPIDEELGHHLHRALLGWTDPHLLFVVASAVAAAVVIFVAYLIAWWRVVDHFSASTTAKQRDLHHSVFRRNCPIWFAACVVSGAAIGAVLAAGLQARAEEIAAFGPLLILMAHVLQTTFYVALRLDPPRADLDREWLARLNAQHLSRGALFAAWAACSLILPQWLLTQSGGVAEDSRDGRRRHRPRGGANGAQGGEPDEKARWPRCQLWGSPV